MSNKTNSGNIWTGVAIYTYGQYYTGECGELVRLNNIVIYYLR